MDATKSRISKMTKEIKNLSQEAKRVEEFEAKAKILEDKQNIIEKLKRQKQGQPRHCTIWRLCSWARQSLTSITENEGKIQFEGGAADHEDISNSNSASKNDQYFTQVQLKVVETKVLDGVRYLKWKINCIGTFQRGNHWKIG